jgi:hypothetical protein
VGASRDLLLQTLGQPDGERAEYLEYFHSMGIGTARVYLQDDRIVKIEWEFRPD